MKVAHLAAAIVLTLPTLTSALTTRPHYSTEDVDEADARTNELIAEYRRVCG